ncbi:hypothetical protein JTB14_036271 [Gonioctena quinquepunctata]|nr:hypothetical protein JTB14_036271 [Gonioctena quinquepunctata]
MVQLLKPAHEALQGISLWKDKDSSSAEKLLGYSLPLAKILQLENSDLAFAMDKAEETISTIKYVRENAEAQFKNIFDEAKQIADMFDIEIKIPRLASKQTNRANASKISFHTMDIYPNVFIILKIFATLPISTSSPERSFSTLRRLKSYLGNTTSENRLNGLAHLNIHREIHVDPKDVMAVLKEKFVKRKIAGNKVHSEIPEDKGRISIISAYGTYLDDFNRPEKREEHIRTLEKIEQEDKLEATKSLFRKPEGTLLQKTLFYYTWPIQLILKCTIPNPKLYPKYFLVTFFMCIVWIGVNSYVVTWMITIIGNLAHISDAVLGMTFVAAGSALPESISMAIIARKGEWVL